ncbi:IS3 family transposase [Frankia sp. Cas4]|uniref:IS3 family transposase n=1 Tax=Frankia sp. Cas4 TaxID=3073927 RepID=UPI002AD1F86A|nr:IS3 family transposase [Frankia sp. Cas4]
MTSAALVELEPLTSTKEACELLGLARASVYRARAPRMHGPRPAPAVQNQPSALDAAERAEIVAALDSERFADKSPSQAWAVLLDEGCYLGSVSTFYRVLRSDGQVRERRAQASHPARVRPELVADGPDQVWSWDITKLKGPTRGVYFDAYVMLDIYSRKVIYWEVHVTESGELAKAFIENCVAVNHGVMPATIHSDNGTSMTSKNVTALLADLHIERSRSRSKVSNDNPYSEAAFKTMKYCPAFPDNFTSIYDARDFAETFFVYYNTEHRHSGIGLYTPASVHDGTWKYVRDRRQIVLDAAYVEHPERFHRGPPQAPKLPGRVWINRPPSKIETEEDQPTTSTS